MLSNYVPGSSPEVEMLQLLADAFRAWKWFCGYLVLRQVYSLMAMSGSKHPGSSPSEWQGVGVNRKRSKNNFSLWRTGLADLWSRQTSVDALEHASYSSGHIVCAPVTASLKSSDSAAELGTSMYYVPVMMNSEERSQTGFFSLFIY